MNKEKKKEIIENLEKKKKYSVYTEDDFNGGFVIEAKNFKEAEEQIIDLIDIHEINENGEIID